jgi:CRP/FNR family transcriptional regulator, cyclic AMP receptor protein
MLLDTAAFQEKLGALPLTSYKAGETVLFEGSTSGRLVILKTGKVSVVKDDIQIAEVAEPGAVFGELSALLDQPHEADVFVLEASQFHVADAETLLKEDQIALLYVAVVLARRLDNANRALIDLKSQVQAGLARSEIGQMLKKIESLLSSDSPTLQR